MRAAGIAVGTFLLCAGACASSTSNIADFRARCALPGRCESALPCEGATLSVRGRIDHANVFDRSRHPKLPYEKFWLVDPASRQVVEVWVTGPDSAAIFARIHAATSRPSAAVRVTGVARGFDMHVSGSCSRDARLELRAAADLFIEP